MRIRKRQAPFPLSSLSPVPLSDPHFDRSPVVQLQLQLHSSSKQADTIAHLDPQPSDHPNQSIGGGTNGTAHEEEKEDCLVLLKREEQKERRKEGESNTNDTRNKDNLGAEVGTWVLPQSNSSQQAFGRWCEGEKAFPLKKRRGSFKREAANHENTIIMEKDKKVNNIVNTKMKTKMNKKCVQQNGDQDEKETKDVVKKRGSIRGGALMEGSRCSRVNGRGWRCCQQTLVGYSLCEHHLGKGRQRTMTSVRSRSLATTNIIAPKKKLETSTDHHPLSSSSSSTLQEKQQKGIIISLDDYDDDDDDDDDDYDSEIDGNGEDQDHKPIMTTKKRVKLGMVKARSISSLLGQTNNAVAVADNEK